MENWNSWRTSFSFQPLYPPSSPELRTSLPQVLWQQVVQGGEQFFILSNSLPMNKCEQCSYSTVMSVNFLVHLRKHKGERPFKCDQCPYEPSQQTILKIHIRSVHENLFFECEQCKYKASQKSNLKVHVQVKHCQLKVKCTVCGEIVRKGYLKEHLERASIWEWSTVVMNVN